MNVKKLSTPKKTSNSTLFIGELTRPWKMKCSLPIEINTPKRFSSEGNSNILHREETLSFYVWIEEGMKRVEKDFLIFLVKAIAKSSTELLTSNKWKQFMLIWIILMILIQVSYFQLWVYYLKLRKVISIRKLFAPQTHLNINYGAIKLERTEYHKQKGKPFSTRWN